METPKDHDIEKRLIGSILIEPHRLSNVLEVITADAFYFTETKAIFETFIELNAKYTPIDLGTVASALKDNGKMKIVGTTLDLVKLTNLVGSTSNTSSLAVILKEKQLLRQLIDLGQNIAANALKTGGEVTDIVSMVEKELTAITSKLLTSKITSSAELYKDAIMHNDKLIANTGQVVGIDTGLKKLNAITNGWQKSDLIILAARPAMGKTSLALKLLSSPALQGKATAIFSLEMSNRQLYARLISQLTDVPLENILRTGMNEYQLKEVLGKADMFCTSKIFFDDTGGISLFELQNKARKLKREKNIEVLIIDYLQLVVNKSKGGNREGEVSEVSRSLKALAKELDIPVIALAQLSRANEQRANKIPILSDLRESGSIEQDADMVMFIHRPEVYGIESFEDGTSTAGRAELIVAKHRNGSIGTIDVGFDGRRTLFHDLETTYTPF